MGGHRHARTGPGRRRVGTALGVSGVDVRGLVSHLIGIERTLLGDPSPPPLTELPAHVENEIGARNEAWVAPRRSLPGHVVLAEFRDVTARPPGSVGGVARSPIRRDRPEPGRQRRVPRIL